MDVNSRSAKPADLPADPKEGWDRFIEGLRTAVDRMDALTADLDPLERADGFQVLARSLGVQLEAVEMDRALPEPIPHNTWRTKFLMDNPDGRYWTFEVEPGGVYRISGCLGGAAYTAVNVYVQRERWHDTAEAASLHDREMVVDPGGHFEIMLGGERNDCPNWLPLPADARTVWLRQFYDDVHADAPGEFRVESLNHAGPPPIVVPARLAERLAIGGKKLRSTTSAIRHAGEHELSRGNHIRTWSEMHSGAVFTSSDIWYQRGAWRLEPGQALVIEGSAIPSQFWNIVLYSRFLNSLEHRHRSVSLTGRKVTAASDGSFRLVLCADDPGVPNWLDTEGRREGMFALRWVFPEREPPLPTARVVDRDALVAEA